MSIQRKLHAITCFIRPRLVIAHFSACSEALRVCFIFVRVIIIIIIGFLLPMFRCWHCCSQRHHVHELNTSESNTNKSNTSLGNLYKELDSSPTHVPCMQYYRKIVSLIIEFSLIKSGRVPLERWKVCVSLAWYYNDKVKYHFTLDGLKKGTIGVFTWNRVGSEIFFCPFVYVRLPNTCLPHIYLIQCSIHSLIGILCRKKPPSSDKLHFNWYLNEWCIIKSTLHIIFTPILCKFRIF